MKPIVFQIGFSLENWFLVVELKLFELCSRIEINYTKLQFPWTKEICLTSCHSELLLLETQSLDRFSEADCKFQSGVITVLFVSFFRRIVTIYWNVF